MEGLFLCVNNEKREREMKQMVAAGMLLALNSAHAALSLIHI